MNRPALDPGLFGGPIQPVGMLLRGLITVYQWTLRPLLGAHCRFHPSCSTYAQEAILRHGALAGSLLGARRILRCNPWVEGGEDPVPCTCPRWLGLGPMPARPIDDPLSSSAVPAKGDPA